MFAAVGQAIDRAVWSRSFTFSVIGADPCIEDIWNLQMDYGRFLDEPDNLSHGFSVVIGSEAKDKLFSGFSPLGESIRIDGVSFQVVGVIQPRMQEGDNDQNRTRIHSLQHHECAAGQPLSGWHLAGFSGARP